MHASNKENSCRLSLTSLVVSGDVREELSEAGAHGSIQVVEILDSGRGPTTSLIFSYFKILYKKSFSIDARFYDRNPITQ